MDGSAERAVQVILGWQFGFRLSNQSDMNRELKHIWPVAWTFSALALFFGIVARDDWGRLSGRHLEAAFFITAFIAFYLFYRGLRQWFRHRHDRWPPNCSRWRTPSHETSPVALALDNSGDRSFAAGPLSCSHVPDWVHDSRWPDTAWTWVLLRDRRNRFVLVPLE